jgi:hypothetical protein
MTSEQKKIIIQALQNSWEQIAPDCYVDDMGKHDESVVIPQTQVWELACDRLYNDYDRNDEVATAAFQAWQKLGWESDEKKAVLKEAFPYKSYGY